MKKYIAIFLIFGLVFAGAAYAANYMYAKRYLTFKWTGVDLDHTYHCSNNGSTTNCWSWTGGESGGSYLSDTWGYGKYSKAKCTSTNWGCRFIYGIDGVCHMEANRGLYTSGKTVHNANGYWLSHALYGTYGSWHTWVACKTACWLW